VNDGIRAREVRLVNHDGQQLGITPLADALALAQQLDLDLVEVAPDAQPPVCRIMDYNKHRFDVAAKAKESRRKSQRAELKEMRYSVRIGPGDFETKTRKVGQFLRDGHKVKVIIRFRRGREMGRTPFGRQLLERIIEDVDGKVEAPPRLDGTQMWMLLAPPGRNQPAATP
jgi:translation initiation factor IF-3